ncbi:MAG: M50 family metallopeptidase, partial [Thermoplasmatales archaeon]
SNELPNLSLNPGTYVNVTLERAGHTVTEQVVYGLYIIGVLQGYPASAAGIKKGDVIVSIGNAKINNENTLESVLSKYKAGENTTITVFNGSTISSYNITFASDYDYLKSQGISNPGVPKDYPFIGIQVALFGITLFDQYSYLALLKDPLYGGALGFFEYIGLPFHFLLPLPSYLLPTVISNPVMLNLEYLFYWLFWLNFALGLTNILPLVPLDGGYVLMNTPALQKSKRRRDAIVAIVSIIVLFLLLWEIIIPRI